MSAATAQSHPASGIRIPAGPLAAAIGQLAEQTDVTIYARTDLLAGKTASPVEGSLSAESALGQMLKGTGLEVTLTNGVYIIKPRAPAPVTDVMPAQEKSAALVPEKPEDIILVVGSYSQGLDRAVDLKRAADSISDVIVAADIGKLPAVNVAEALQRMPGLTISREAGEGQFVGVRGLGPNFQSVTFNGIPIAFNENIRNSDQSGRQFRFRVLPADLIGGVVVTKSPSADLIDGGIGANIDIVTVKPLDRGNFTAARAFASYDERGGEVTPNGSLSLGRTNAQETLGLIASVSYQRRNVQFDRFQNFGYETHSLGGYEEVQVAGGWNTTIEEEKRRRFSFLGGFQWQPADRIDLHSEILYSNFNNRIAENRITYELGDLITDHLVPGSARIESGILYAGTIEGGRINRNAEYSEQTHENLSLSAGADLEIAGWTVSPTLSFSDARSDLDVPLQRIEGRTVKTEGLLYSFDLGHNPVRDGKIVALSTNLDLTDPTAAPFRRYRIRPVNSKDQDVTALADLSRPLDMEILTIGLTEIRFGAQYTDRFRDYQRRDRMLSLKDGYALDESYYTYPIPGDAFDGLIGDRSLWVGPDFDAFRHAFEVPGEFAGVTPGTGDLEASSADLSQSYRIDETILALYGRLDFETELRDVPVSGNIGVRWVDTQTDVLGTVLQAQGNGSGGVETIAAPRLTESSYEQFLPSLNLKLDLDPNLALRLATSRSMTRPSLASLRDATVPSSATVSEIFELGKAALANTGMDRNAVGGNPALKPYLSTNIDLSLERYFEEFGAFTVSAFYKQIEDFISGDTRQEAWPFAVHDGSTVALELLVNRPQNIGDASISGLEMGYANRFDHGFGLSASVTFTSSETDLELQDGSRQPAQLQGVSDLSYSITPFFERGPFEAYVSYTWRSEFESNSNVTIASDVRTDIRETIVAAGFGTLDFGASYALNDRFDLFAEGVNLTDSHQAAYQGYEARPYQLHQYGRTLNLGLRADF